MSPGPGEPTFDWYRELVDRLDHLSDRLEEVHRDLLAQITGLRQDFTLQALLLNPVLMLNP
jgi:phosphoglycerate-specific signal transduction histidine kinase